MGITSVSDYAWGHLPQHATGTVHSVFSSSLNVELDGLLLHLGGSDAPLSCLGANVDAEEMPALVGSAVQGDRVVFRDGVLRIYSRARVSELELSAAPVRCMRVPELAGAFPNDIDAALLREIGALGLADRTGLPWPDRSRSAVSELARFSAMCRRVLDKGERSCGDAQVEAAERAMHGAVEYLVGRGLGLTPSGDDVLMGFGTALRFLYCGGVSSMAQAFFETVSRVVPGKTTAVSEAYYRAMGEGYANEDYLDLLAVVRAMDEQALPDALARVLELGHTSGADGLLGFGAAFCCLL